MRVDYLLQFEYKEGDWVLSVDVKKFVSTKTTYLVVSQDTKDPSNPAIVRELFPDEQDAMRAAEFYVNNFKREVLSHLTKVMAYHV